MLVFALPSINAALTPLAHTAPCLNPGEAAVVREAFS